MIFGDESDSIDTDTMDQITERYINEASKGDMEGYVKSLIDTFQKTRRALPWYFYLKKLMGKVASGYKKNDDASQSSSTWALGVVWDFAST